jgi:pimeloyl-ACP methyl ester carboxylesterase
MIGKPRRYRNVAAFLSLACLACPSGTKPPDELSNVPSTSHPGYFKWAHSQGVIIFVHGVFGDSSTWSDGTHYWPEMVSNDTTFRDYDIYRFDYASPKCDANAFTIDEIATTLQVYLTKDQVFSTHRNVIFLMHSMGGLVTRQFLIQSPDSIVNKVRLLAFYGTPMNGSNVARLYSLLGGHCANPQVLAMVPGKYGGYLNSQNQTWVARKLGLLPAFCVYEHRPVGPATVVDRASATALCAQAIYPVDGNHLQIVKPGSTRDQSYAILVTEMDSRGLLNRATASDSTATSQTSSPQPARAAEHNALGDDLFKRSTHSTEWPEYRRLLLSALAEYQIAEAFNPEKAVYHINVGTVLNRLGRYEEAAIKLRAGIHLEPSMAWYHNELCMALMQQQKFEDAESPCREAVRLDPTNAAFQQQLDDFLTKAKSNQTEGTHPGTF